MAQFPEFNEREVALLVSSVERSLHHLRDANERVGGNDAELIDYGRQYSVILEKLQSILNRT